MQSSIIRVIALLLLGPCSQATADRLENLPAQWQQQLSTVEPIDASLLKPGVGQTIEPARTVVDTLLQQAKPDTRQLASAFGKLGNLYLTHGLYTSADACYSNAMLLAPDYFPWQYYSAYLAHENGDMHAALSRYKKALETDPEYAPAKYRLAQVYLDLNELDQAYNLFSALINDPDMEAVAYYGLGQTLLVKRDYAGAAEHLTHALELAPEATSIHYPLALSLRSAGKTELAKQHLKQYKKHEIEFHDPLVESLEALKDPATRHFVEAMTAIIRNNYDKSLNEFEAGLEYNPSNTAARTSYARALYITGNREQSRIQLERVVTQDPDKPIALFLLAVLYDESGNREKAAELYKHVIEINDTHEGANFFIGNYYLNHKDFNNAIRHYEIVTSINDKNIAAHILKLTAMMSSGASDQELLTVTRQLLERSPNMPAIKRIQILLLALSTEADVRNSERALTLAEAMYTKHPYPANLELIALSTASMGDYSLATEHMRKALAEEQKQKNILSIERMNNNLLLLEQGKLPGLDWHVEIEYMQPPPTKALATFRDYPDANPI